MHTVYLIPGLGADGRLFKNLKLRNVEVKIIKWIVPYNNESLENYAKRLSQQIETKTPFSIIGVSFGGMCAVEIAKTCNVQNLVIISSAKCKDEIPLYYRISRYFPVYKIMPEWVMKKGTSLVKSVFGILNKGDSKLFSDMIRSCPNGYIIGAIHCIVNWKNNEYPKNIIHIHGSRDMVLPVKNIKNPLLIKGGTHYMIMNRADEINSILKKLF